jgi:DNA-binding response OmpR family regulator
VPARLCPVLVVVVEDEVHLARSLARSLTAEGFDVEMVQGGTDWLRRARSKIAIVLAGSTKRRVRASPATLRLAKRLKSRTHPDCPIWR